MGEHWTRRRGGLLSLSAATLAGALGGAGGAIVAPVPAPAVVVSGALDVASYTRPEDGGDWALAIGWTRLLWRGASSGEVGAMRGGARR